MSERLWTYRDVAEYTGMPEGTLRSMACKGQIPHVRLSPRCARFEPDQVRAWVESRRKAAAK